MPHPPSSQEHASSAPPVQLLHLSPPPFAHQVAGHGQPGGAGGFRVHQRQRSIASLPVQVAAGHVAAAVSTAADAASPMPASADHQRTVLKPVPLHKEKGACEQRFYERLDAMRRQVLAGVVQPPPPVCWCGLATAGETTEEGDSSSAADSLSPQSLHLGALRSWLTFFPRFYGTVTLREASIHSSDTNTDAELACSHYLHLEDVTQPYAHPSLLDVKIGTHSWDPFAVAEAAATGEAAGVDLDKVRREIAKCPSQRRTGFRICGARVWQPPSGVQQTGDATSSDRSLGSYASYGKQWARNISVDDIQQPFWTFFGHTKSGSDGAASGVHEAPSQDARRTAALVLPVYIARLRKLLHLCQSAPLWRFYASSILFSYQLQDADQEPQLQAQALSSSLSAPHPGASFPLAGRAELHLIDFGHAYGIERPLPTHLDALLDDDTAATITDEECADRPASGDKSSGATCTCGLPTATLDTNYIAGITSLINIFESMLERALTPGS